MNLIDRLRTAPKGTQVSFCYPIGSGASGEDTFPVEQLRKLVLTPETRAMANTPMLIAEIDNLIAEARRINRECSNGGTD